MKEEQDMIAHDSSIVGRSSTYESIRTRPIPRKRLSRKSGHISRWDFSQAAQPNDMRY